MKFSMTGQEKGDLLKKIPFILNFLWREKKNVTF